MRIRYQWIYRSVVHRRFSMTVSTLSIVCMAISALVTAGVFAALFCILKIRFKQPWQPFLAGCLTFLVTVMILEPALHQVVLSSAAGTTIQSNIWLYGLYGAFAATLFEETGRFITMKFFLKKYHNQDIAGIMYGAGHGGFEAFMLLGITMISNIAVALSVNSGTLAAQTAGLDAASLSAVQTQVMQLCTTPAWMYALGIVERLFAITAQIAMSMLMWRGVVKTNVGYIALACAFHFFMDSVSVISSAFIGAVGTEIIIAVTALGMILVAKSFMKK